MNRSLFWFLFLLLWAYSLQASDTKKGARALGMGGAYVALANTNDAFYYNPAGLWQLTNPQVQAFYSAPFNLRDLATTTFNVTYPMSWGNGAASFESYGFDLYRESTFGLAYSGGFREKFVYGIEANYYHVAIKDGGSAGTIGFDAGLLFKIHPYVTVGFTSRNINQPVIAHDELAQVMALGVSVNMFEPLTINADLYKDVRYDTDIRVGAEYELIRKLFLRVGVASKPSSFSAGLGFDFGIGVIDYALYTHEDLGVTHAVSASIHLQRQAIRKIQ
ncbi:hypothetical protein K1X84_15910 [bacterium]|nr:hypothetical protein [bacterium]